MSDKLVEIEARAAQLVLDDDSLHPCGFQYLEPHKLTASWLELGIPDYLPPTVLRRIGSVPPFFGPTGLPLLCPSVDKSDVLSSFRVAGGFIENVTVMDIVAEAPEDYRVRVHGESAATARAQDRSDVSNVSTRL